MRTKLKSIDRTTSISSTPQNIKVTKLAYQSKMIRHKKKQKNIEQLGWGEVGCVLKCKLQNCTPEVLPGDLGVGSPTFLWRKLENDE